MSDRVLLVSTDHQFDYVIQPQINVTMAKIIIAVLAILMLIALGMGLYYLVRTPVEGDNGGKLVKALTWRIGIWIVLFGFIFISIKAGWIEPSVSVNPEKFRAEQQSRMDDNQ